MSYPLILIDSQESIKNAANNLEMLNALVQARRNFYEENGHQKLTRWLIRGSLILDEYGGIALFTPLEHFKNFDFPDVVEMEKIDVNGWTQAGGSQHSLPKEGSICPYCGKEVTIEDVYSHNFCVETPNNSFAHHAGNCKTFHNTFEFSFAVAKEMILIAKRTFGKIEKICVQEGNQKQNPSITISFIALNHQIEIIVGQFYGDITITYQKDDTKGRIGDNYYYSASTVEEKLKEWKDTL